MDVRNAIVEARSALIAPHGLLLATGVCAAAVSWRHGESESALVLRLALPGTRCGNVQFISWSSSYLRGLLQFQKGGGEGWIWSCRFQFERGKQRHVPLHRVVQACARVLETYGVVKTLYLLC
jgi:hypothetical protein